MIAEDVAEHAVAPEAVTAADGRLLAEQVGGKLAPPTNILVVDRIGWSRRIVLTYDDVALH